MSSVNKTIQQKSDELAKMVAWFDSADFNLEEALDRFKTAEKLAAEIEKDLLTLKNKIKVIKQKFDSEIL